MEVPHLENDVSAILQTYLKQYISIDGSSVWYMWERLFFTGYSAAVLLSKIARIRLTFSRTNA